MDTTMVWTVLILMLIFIIVIYALVAFPLMKIAERTKTPRKWLAWVPIANIFLLGNIAKVSIWMPITVVATQLLVQVTTFFGGLWDIASLALTFVSLVLIAYMMMMVCERLGKSRYLGVLGIVPIVNIVLLWFLAYTKKGRS